MPEEWLEIAYINFEKAILHGRVTDGRDKHNCRIEREVEQVLTDDQKAKVQSLNIKHDNQMRGLLRTFVDDVAS